MALSNRKTIFFQTALGTPLFETWASRPQVQVRDLRPCTPPSRGSHESHSPPVNEGAASDSNFRGKPRIMVTIQGLRVMDAMPFPIFFGLHQCPVVLYASFPGRGEALNFLRDLTLRRENVLPYTYRPKSRYY